MTNERMPQTEPADDVSETVSEKRRRGRPRVMNDEQEAAARRFFPSITHRHLMNMDYCTRAIALLADDDRFTWIVDKAKCWAGAPHAWKPSILTELGRIEDVGEMEDMAARICELRPKTKEAVAIIRRWRTGASGIGDVLGVYRAICGAVNDYYRRYPQTPRSEIGDALEIALTAIRQGASEGPSTDEEATDA